MVPFASTRFQVTEPVDEVIRRTSSTSSSKAELIGWQFVPVAATEPELAALPNEVFSASDTQASAFACTPKVGITEARRDASGTSVSADAKLVSITRRITATVYTPTKHRYAIAPTTERMRGPITSPILQADQCQLSLCSPAPKIECSDSYARRDVITSGQSWLCGMSSDEKRPKSPKSSNLAIPVRVAELLPAELIAC